MDGLLKKSQVEDAATSGLTISDLAERTGLAPATLRAWESRHGFPAPDRLPGRHRRYNAGHVALVREVLRRREGGMTLEAAIAAVSATDDQPDQSVFSGLRRAHPHLPVSTLSKRTLLALSHAVEEECLARADRPLMFGSFQHQRYYERARTRWADLARTARATVVLADFGGPQEPSGSPLLVHVPESAPLRREWAIICDSPRYPACFTAWELPGQSLVPDQDRLFESLWTLDPAEVRTAARLAGALATEYAPEHRDLLPQADPSAPASGSSDLAAATSLFSRVLAHVDRLGS